MLAGSLQKEGSNMVVISKWQASHYHGVQDNTPASGGKASVNN